MRHPEYEHYHNIERRPGILEKAVAFVKTKIRYALENGVVGAGIGALPGLALKALGVVKAAAATTIAAVGAIIVGVGLAYGGYKFGERLYNEIFDRQTTPAEMDHWLTKVAAEVSTSILPAVEALAIGVGAGVAVAMNVANPITPIAIGAVVGGAAAVGNYRFGNTLRRQINHGGGRMSAAFMMTRRLGGMSFGSNGSW